MAAADGNAPPLVRLLLAAGADASLADDDGTDRGIPNDRSGVSGVTDVLAANDRRASPAPAGRR